MNTSIVTRHTSKCVKSIVSGLLLAGLTLSASNTYATQVNDAPSASKTTEIIGIVGTQHLSQFRRDLQNAENNFFSLMNTVVSDDDFKVECKTQHLQAFSRLKGRKCEANFVSRLIGEQTQRDFDLQGPGAKLANSFEMTSSVSVQLKLKQRQQDYLEELVTQINSNPHLLEAYNKLRIAKASYAEAKASL